MFLSKNKRSGYYHIIYDDLNGKRKTKTTKSKNKADAMKFLLSFQKEIQIKKNATSEAITLQQFYYKFYKFIEARLKQKTVKVYKTTFTYLIKKYGTGKIINSFTTTDLEDIITERSLTRSKFTARKFRSDFAGIFKFAYERGYHHLNIAENLSPVKLPEQLPLAYSLEEFKRLLESIDNSDDKDITIFAVHTGFRQGEILNLEWDNVDIYKKQITFHNRGNFITKSSKIKKFPLNDIAFEIISKRYWQNFESTAKCQFVFNYNKDKIDQDKFSRNFKQYIYKAKINNKLNFHSLRHTFATWLLDQGVSIFEVNHLLGHDPSSLPITAKYIDISKIDLKKATNSIKDLIDLGAFKASRIHFLEQMIEGGVA